MIHPIYFPYNYKSPCLMINPAFQSIPAIQNIAKAPFRLQLCAFSTAMGDSSSVLRPNCWVMATPRSERDGREEIRH